ncbi:hypothetical protein [Streptomyces tirandamycinicus]|uniref:Uncharacterized protein n=1 Tax=Streptomyces tirandamycinicus TaxID=2174846 RepID=A0A2S1SXV6_9ACTN|nr:hypothetical protein [Streptomyces tirandamycinicus]AWI31242.1 hypothetical protein DDW44_22495 [Streptomyces tirandamycinicus]
MGSGRENSRDSRQHVEIALVDGPPGGQGIGQLSSSECELIGELQRGHTLVLGEQALCVARSEGARVEPLAGAIRLGLAGA